MAYSIECFHMTSRRPCWCPKPILWELNSFLMQTLSFVPINLHKCWPREWNTLLQFAKKKWDSFVFGKRCDWTIFFQVSRFEHLHRSFNPLFLKWHILIKTDALSVCSFYCYLFIVQETDFEQPAIQLAHITTCILSN